MTLLFDGVWGPDTKAVFWLLEPKCSACYFFELSEIHDYVKINPIDLMLI